MTAQAALTFFLAVFIFGITPGPGVFAILARALAQGAWACSWLALGMVISDICYLVMACYGLAMVATHWEEVFTLIRLLGAAYLLYLGWKMWRAVPELAQGEVDTSRRGALLSFLQGFLISASNPKVILFYIAFLPTFMDLSQLSHEDVLLAAVLTLIALMLGLMLIAWAAARARRYFRSPQAMRGLNRVAGSIMASAGLYLGVKG